MGRATIRSWLQLVRAPNLLTVPGDPLAGGCLALALLGGDSLTPILPALLVSLCLYAAGLILNDVFDLTEDRRDRAQRPLPAGQISVGGAVAVAMVLILAALGVAFRMGPVPFGLTLVLLVAILLYDGILKRLGAVGALLMGVCRGLSFMLGAAAVGREAIGEALMITAALVLGAYIMAVTRLAGEEHRRTDLGKMPAVSIAAFMAAAGVVAACTYGWGLLALVPMAVAIAGTAQLARDLRGKPEPALVQRSIGRYIRLLLPVQASLCLVLFPAGLLPGLVLLALWPLSGLVGRWFYAS